MKGLDEPVFVAGTGTALIKVGTRCFADPHRHLHGRALGQVRPLQVIARYRSGLAGSARLAHEVGVDAARASRPSQIAHTTSDWPRRASPQANTPGTVVW